MRRALLAMALVALLSACSGGGVVTQADAPERTTDTTVVTPEPEATQDATPERPTSATVGQSITLNGSEPGLEVAVTVEKVVTDGLKGNDEFTVPDKGNRFVAVQFLLRNIGTAAYEDSPGNGAKVIDNQSQQYDPAFTESNAGVALPALVRIAPGRQARGFITFEVPAATKIAGVQFGLESGFGQTGEWAAA